MNTDAIVVAVGLEKEAQEYTYILFLNQKNDQKIRY
jgi:hypothetical protein